MDEAVEDLSKIDKVARWLVPKLNGEKIKI